MKITIYGAGYVGLVTAACVAELGHTVLCIDIDAAKIQQLQQGIVSIYEPGLAELVKSNLADNKISFSTDAMLGVSFSSVQMITVNTPTLADQGSDISQIIQVANTIAQHMEEPKLIINKSTAPPGTVQKIKYAMARINQKVPFEVASNPEFLKEGAAITDFLQPDRIIVGIESENIKKVFTEIYHLLSDKLIYMDVVSAELSKYAANAMLATKISFMNEMANISEKVGADIERVKQAIGLDPRIGPHFINPGCGYGGSCFPKDVQALTYVAKEVGIDPKLLTAVEKINQSQKKIIATKILNYFNNALQGKIIAVWGLAFKPNTNDMREASSIELMKMLWEHGAVIQAYDPIANDEASRLFEKEIAAKKLILCKDILSVLDHCSALAIVTEWDEFKNISLPTLKNSLLHQPIFDGRNIFDPSAMKEVGIEYISIGR